MVRRRGAHVSRAKLQARRRRECSTRRDHPHAGRPRPSSQAVVIGDDARQCVTELQRGREVDRVQRPQRERFQATRRLERRGNRRDQRHGVQDLAGPQREVNGYSPDRTHEFRSDEIRSDQYGRSYPDPCQQRARFRLGNHELRQSRRVDVEGGSAYNYRSASLMAASVALMSGPGSGVGRSAKARRGGRARCACINRSR